MNITPEEAFSRFCTRMNKDDDAPYIKMDLLKDNYSYKIWARNAYVGIWMEDKHAFLISRYKVGPNPYLDIESHWDYCVDPTVDWGEGREKGLYGTAKPLKLIEKSPFELKDTYQESEKKQILQYLDDLEENNPIIKGFNSLQDRKESSIKFKQRLNGSKSTIEKNKKRSAALIKKIMESKI